MKKRIAIPVCALAITMFLGGCRTDGGKPIPTPTPQIKPGIVTASTPTPMIAEGQETTGIPEPTPAETPTLEPTLIVTPVSTPALTATATPIPTSAPAVTSVPVPTMLPTSAPLPTLAPDVAPEQGISELGTITDHVYENEFLGLRFTAPDDVSITQEEDVLLAAYWPGDGMIAQMVKEPPTEDYATAEEYAAVIISDLKMLASLGMNYVIEGDLSLADIAEREYIHVSSSIETEEGKLYQDYYIREQDGNLYVLMMFYDEEHKEEKQEVLDAFSVH